MRQKIAYQLKITAYGLVLFGVLGFFLMNNNRKTYLYCLPAALLLYFLSMVFKKWGTKKIDADENGNAIPKKM